MSVTATFRRESELVVIVFEDHLGRQYSETFMGASLTDAQIQARADARALEVAESLAQAEFEGLL